MYFARKQRRQVAIALSAPIAAAAEQLYAISRQGEPHGGPQNSFETYLAEKLEIAIADTWRDLTNGRSLPMPEPAEGDRRRVERRQADRRKACISAPGPIAIAIER